ncbi:hypothetical protein ACJMK2_017337, partial [Sinanodonta woodiana]
KKPLRNSNFTVASQERTKTESSFQEYADLEISTLIPLSSFLQASNIKEVFSVPFKSVVGDGEDPISHCHGDMVEGKDLEYNNMRSISSSLLSAYSLKSARKTIKTAHVHVNKDIKDGNDKSSAKSYKGTWCCHFDRENKQAVYLDETCKRTRKKSTKEHVSQNNDTFMYIKHKKGLNARSPSSKHKWNMEISWY